MFYGQKEVDRFIYETYFPQKRNGFFIECGAFDGLLECTCKFFEDSLGWSGVNIEPVPFLFNKLVINRPNCTNLNLAISNENCAKEFTQAIHPVRGNDFGNGSIKHSKEHYENLIAQGCGFEKFQVQCYRFCDLGISTPIDLFILDIEGHELEAIQGILPSANLPYIFCIEYNMICDGINKINSALDGKYKLDKLYEQNAFYVRL